MQKTNRLHANGVLDRPGQQTQFPWAALEVLKANNTQPSTMKETI